MNNVERIELFKTSLQPEALMPAFRELLDDKAALGALLQEELSGFAALGAGYGLRVQIGG